VSKEELEAELERVKMLALALADAAEWFNDGCGCCGNGSSTRTLDEYWAVLALRGETKD
jgi:hypothetical protein